MTPLALDHIAVAGATLEEAVAHVEDALGVEIGAGGSHPAMGTHNRLLSLDGGVYLEAISVDPGAPPPTRPRWFGLDDFSGPARLAAWIVRGSAREGLPGEIGEHIRMSRGELSWDITVRDDGTLPWAGAVPCHIDWGQGGPAGARMPASGCRLLRLEVTHPDAASLLRVWPGLLALDTVRIGPGPSPTLRAEILTPHGLRYLA